MKKLIYFLFTIIFSFKNIYAQPEIGYAEILIRNYSGSQDSIKVKVYPVGAVFSGMDFQSNIDHKYSLIRCRPDVTCHWFVNPLDSFQYIIGGNKIIPINNFGLIDFDDGQYFHSGDSIKNARVIGGISYGLWKFEFYTLDSSSQFGNLIEECFMDYRDLNFNSVGPDIELRIVRKANCFTDSLVFQFNSGTEVNIQDSRIVNKTIKMWDRVGTGLPVFSGSPNRGLFKSVSLFSDYPIDATQYGAVNHYNPGNLALNLEIQDDSYMSNLVDTPTVININPDVFLRISDNKVLDFTEINSTNPDAHFEMNVETNGKLLLNPNSNIIIRKNNKLNLQDDSRLYLGSGAEIVVKQGGLFCNYGASIRGSGKVIYEGGIIHHIQCASLADYVIRDSAKYILDSNAVLEIPDSTTLHFTGSNTALIMYQNSVIKLGVNSKIVIDISATITAKGAQFTSLDTNEIREDIVLENSGIDSTVNCTFSDAKTAVSIVNDPGYSFAPRVIKGNTFNVPSGGDHAGIYGENNFRITISDNVFNMPANPANNVFGVFLKNSNTEGVESLPEENEPAPQYRMFLIDNIFNHGKISVLFT